MKFKLIHWAYCGLACLVLLSCHRDKREELFTLNDHVDFTIQPGLNTFDTHIYAISPKISMLNDRLDDAGISPDKVVAIEAKRAYLSSIFEDVNLDFIDKISVYIFDPYNTNNKIECFYLEPIPFKDKVGIQLFPGIADVSEWLENDYFGIEIRLDFRQVTPSLVQMRLDFDFRVLGE